jgi:predicted MFS family arabinose efflux permease
MSIVASGLMLGILLARLLSGIIANYTSWRVVYWLSVAAQYTIFLLLWLFMPDYPSTNPEGMNYFKMLWSIVLMVGRHPVLVQACGIAFFASATFTNFWTTLTFLLAGPPYYYTPVIIGLLALVGIASMLCGPVYARYVTDRFVPWFSVFLGMVWSIIGIAVGTYTGTFSVAGPIVQAFFGDFGMITAQIANRSAIFAVEPTGRNRVNTAFMVFTFAGQLVGTFVGSQLYDRGGWIASGSFSMGSIGMALLITMARGPWEEGMFSGLSSTIRRRLLVSSIPLTDLVWQVGSDGTAATASRSKAKKARTAASSKREAISRNGNIRRWQQKSRSKRLCRLSINTIIRTATTIWRR